MPWEPPEFSLYIGVLDRQRRKTEGRGTVAGLLYIGKCIFRCPIENITHQSFIPYLKVFRLQLQVILRCKRGINVTAFL